MNFSHLLFDMDNTLYPASSAMNDGITRRMLECVADFFACSIEDAIKLRKKRITHFSTTLEWLCSEGLTDIEGFLKHVHPENEADELIPQEGLRDFLISLPFKKSILTNAPYEHASRVLSKLGIEDLFDAVTDIRDANFQGKPYPASYCAALEKVNETIDSTLFLDDMKKYTDGWVAMGGTAVLIGNENGKPLCEDSQAMICAKSSRLSNRKGETIHLKSIYEIKSIL